MHRARRPAHALVVDVLVSEPNVVGDRSRKQMHVLQHQAEQPAQIGEIERADVHAVDGDPAPLNVVEAQQQVDQRRLPRAGCTDNPDALTGLHLEADVPENPVGICVSGERCRFAFAYR